MRIKDYTDMVGHLTDSFNIPEARRMIAENPALTQEQFTANRLKWMEEPTEQAPWDKPETPWSEEPKEPYPWEAKEGGIVEPGVTHYGKEDELGTNINYLKEAKPYKKPVYRLNVTFPPGMKKKQINMLREATPENLKMMKKLRDKLHGEIDTFYGPNRITMEDMFKVRDKHPTLTNKQIAEKLKGKIGPYGDSFTEASIKKATSDAGKTGKYGQFVYW